MVALMANHPETQGLVVLDVKARLCFLLLQAQRMEAAGHECWFQLGINLDLLEKGE